MTVDFRKVVAVLGEVHATAPAIPGRKNRTTSSLIVVILMISIICRWFVRGQHYGSKSWLCFPRQGNKLAIDGCFGPLNSPFLNAQISYLHLIVQLIDF